MASNRIPMGLVVAAALAAAAAPSHAIVNWAQPSGIAPIFTYHTGYTNSGFFGDPIIVGNTFVFEPADFSATTGINGSRSDTLQVDIVARPGYTITGIIVREWGTRTHTGSTGVSGTLFLNDMDTPAFPDFQDALTYTTTGVSPNMNWFGTRERSGISMTTLQLSLTNNLSAALSGRSIRKTRVEIEIIPAPAGMAVAGAAGMLAVRRRRR